MPSSQLPNPIEEGVFSTVLQRTGKIVKYGLIVWLPSDEISLQKRLYLRGNKKPFPIKVVIKWLDAEPVTAAKQLPFSTIPDGKCPHAIKSTKTPISPFFIAM